MLVCICLNNMQIMLNSSDSIVQLQFCKILIGVIFDGFRFSKFTSQEKDVQQEQSKLNLTLPLAWIPCLFDYQTDKSNEPYCNISEKTIAYKVHWQPDQVKANLEFRS